MFSGWRSGRDDAAGDEEAPAATMPNSPDSSGGNGSEPVASTGISNMQPDPRRQLQHKLSAVSRMYDIDGDGVLNDTEKAMRNLDGSGRGFISNEKVYRLMEQSLKLQNQVSPQKPAYIMACIIFCSIMWPSMSNVSCVGSHMRSCAHVTCCAEGYLHGIPCVS